MWAPSVFFKKTPKENNHPMGPNRPIWSPCEWHSSASKVQKDRFKVVLKITVEKSTPYISQFYEICSFGRNLRIKAKMVKNIVFLWIFCHRSKEFSPKIIKYTFVCCSWMKIQG
jgi:hypothetical protein